jgi:hypothetical protein
MTEDRNPEAPHIQFYQDKTWIKHQLDTTKHVAIDYLNKFQNQIKLANNSALLVCSQLNSASSRPK